MNQPVTLALSDLGKGKHGMVSAIDFVPPVQQRLRHLGIQLGEQVTVIRSSVANSPLMVRINGAYLMMRRQDAQHIQVAIAS